VRPGLQRLIRNKKRQRQELAKVEPARLPVAATELVQKALDYAEEGIGSASTRRVYATQWRAFEQWCASHACEPLPAQPAALVLYLTERAGAGAGRSTIDQIVAAVNQKHELADLPKPSQAREVKLVVRGIRKRVARAKRRASPLAPDLLRQMVRAMPEGSLASKRDAALVLTGFGGALRRQELVDVDVEHVEFHEDGMKVYLPRSKTDQEGEGALVSIPFGSDKHTCPVRAMRAWLAASGIASGCVFQGVTRRGKLSGKRLDGRDVARIVQRAARRAGITLDRISGHSLRAGLGTTAAKEDKRIDVIQKHMRHKRMEQTVEYIRDAKAFDPDENAASGIGL